MSITDVNTHNLETLELLQKFYDEMVSSNKRNDKKRVLAKWFSSNIVRNLVVFIYNPFNKLGVTSNTVNSYEGNKFTKKDYYLYNLLRDLAQRELTGHEALEVCKDFKYSMPERFFPLLDKIFDCDLKIGVDVKTINECWDNIVPTFDVALAHDINKSKSYQKRVDTERYFIMRKLDGVRCITVIKNGEIRFYSRLGNEFTTLDVIRKELEKYQFPDGIVLDGELCVIENDTENFKLAVSQIKRKDYTMQDAHYKVFDALTFSEFISSSVPSPNYSHRIMRLKDLFRRCPNSPFLSVLGAIEYNPHNFSRAQNVVAQKGWEGLILRADTPYKFGRSSDILKVKSFTDSEYIIEDIVSTTKLMQQLDGTMKEVKCMGAIIIRHKGNPVKVGSGFTDAQRIDMWENDTKYIGKSVTIKYFEESTDEHGNPSLRFPIFVNFRETME